MIWPRLQFSFPVTKRAQKGKHWTVRRPWEHRFPRINGRTENFRTINAELSVEERIHLSVIATHCFLLFTAVVIAAERAGQRPTLEPTCYHIWRYSATFARQNEHLAPLLLSHLTSLFIWGILTVGIWAYWWQVRVIRSIAHGQMFPLETIVQ